MIAVTIVTIVPFIWFYNRSGFTEKGGNQIEYADQDPRIHRMFVEELAKQGIAAKMEQFAACGIEIR